METRAVADDHERAALATSLEAEMDIKCRWIRHFADCVSSCMEQVKGGDPAAAYVSIRKARSAVAEMETVIAEHEALWTEWKEAVRPTPVPSQPESSAPTVAV